MSWQQIEDNWRQFVGEAKNRWGKLTDNDLKECEGNRDKLVGKLQQLYKLAPDQAGEEIAHIERHIIEAKQGAEKMYGVKS
ncbi:MAG: CsbD family protein [Gammaproteobacteria bacterium]